MKYLRITLILGLHLSIQDVAHAACEGTFGCSDEAQIEELNQSLESFKESMVNGQLAEAEILAKRMMELSIVLNGRNSVDSANALTNLAYAQYKQGQFGLSRLNLRAAIKTIEEIGGNLSGNLIRPLHRLGQTELALDDTDNATVHFERAVHIGHVQNGPQNTEQIESLEAIAEIHADSGNVGAALDIQKSIVAYRARAVGPESDELLPALQHYANWMRRLQLYNLETNTYFQMLKIQEGQHGPDDPRLISTLILIGTTYHETGYSRLDDRYSPRQVGPEYYMKRAMRIAEKQPQTSWKVRAHTTLTVGDFYTRAQYFTHARYSYNDAWQQLSNDPAGLTLRREELESPKLIERHDLPEYYEDENPLYEPAAKDKFLRGTITAEFDVTRLGESVNIKLVESQPPGLSKIEKRLVDTIQSIMHRPRMADGSMVGTQKLTYVYEFFYRDSDSPN